MERIIKDYIKNTNKYWLLPQKSLFHNTISLLTSQKIKFSESRNIRKKLYELNQEQNEYSIKIFENLTNKDFIKCGISNNIIEIIKNVIELEKNKLLTIEKLENLKGIGPWTIKSLKIMNNFDNNIFLYEDYWIRQRLSELVKSNKILTQSECKKIFINSTNCSEISMFLWRIKKSGTFQIINNLELTKDNFL
jgi:3-methyladenine DNA glycosylase/8-oxoguanine DNA glycosylase